MDPVSLITLLCVGLMVGGLVMVATAFRLRPRGSPGLPPAQLVIDGKHDLGDRRSRIGVRASRLAGGILIVVVAAIAGVAAVGYGLQHMKIEFRGIF